MATDLPVDLDTWCAGKSPDDLRNAHRRHHDALHRGYTQARHLSDYAGLQGAVDDTPFGGVLLVPPGHHIFGSVKINRAITLRGVYGATENAAAWNSSGWAREWFRRDRGCVLVSEATSGAAIDATVPMQGVNLEHIVVRGADPTNADVTGVAVGAPGSYAGLLRWYDATVCNFKTGVRLTETFEGVFYSLSLVGCDTGLHMVDSNALVFSNMRIMKVRQGVQIDRGYSNVWFGGTVQGVSDTGFTINNAHENALTGVYFENPEGVNAAVINGNRNEMVMCHLGTQGDRVYLGGSGNHVYVGNATNGQITIAGSQNIVDNAQDYRVTIDPAAWWPMARGVRNIGHATTIAPHIFRFGGQRRGGLALEDGDLFLKDDNGNWWRVRVATDGTLTTSAIT